MVRSHVYIGGSAGVKTDYKKGSFTIEAAFLIPFILFLYLYVLQAGIAFFQESITGTLYQQTEKLDVVKQFYQLQRMKDVMEDE